MSGLVLTLESGERFFVNGALLENGSKPSRLRVKDGAARVLRCRDALQPEAVTTPVKQVYYAIQLMITGDLEDGIVLPALWRELDALEPVFAPLDKTLVSTLREMLDRETYYSALCHLRSMILLEAELLARGQRAGKPDQSRAA